jgi:Ras-related protein Rab-2A
MEKNCAPLPGDVIPQNTNTPMKGSDFDFNLINNNNNKEEEDSDDSGDFTPNNPNKPRKPQKKDKIEILGKNIKPDLKFKVIVVGNMNVGKSCLALRATEGMFKENLGSTVPLSICSFNVKINESKISLQIWDTCGQEVYRSLINSFYRNSSLAILLYSIDNIRSFNNLEMWLNDIKVNSNPSIKVFLIGNKKDLEEKRQVPIDKAKTFYKDHNIHLFLEASAKTGFNAQKIFIEAAKILYKEHLELDTKLELNSDKNEIVKLAQEGEIDLEDGIEPVKRKKCC